jgi:hypothetical protein
MNRVQWNKRARKLLLGKRIVKVQYMSSEESEQMGWYTCSVLIGLEDGTWIVPQSDDEGNEAGVLGIASEKDYEVLPILSQNHK